MRIFYNFAEIPEGLDNPTLPYLYDNTLTTEFVADEHFVNFRLGNQRLSDYNYILFLQYENIEGIRVYYTYPISPKSGDYLVIYAESGNFQKSKGYIVAETKGAPIKIKQMMVGYYIDVPLSTNAVLKTSKPDYRVSKAGIFFQNKSVKVARMFESQIPIMEEEQKNKLFSLQLQNNNRPVLVQFEKGEMEQGHMLAVVHFSSFQMKGTKYISKIKIQEVF